MSILKEDLNLGDHIYVRRLLYSHHGIYTGYGTVIHYAGEEKEKKNPMIRETELGDFLKGGRLRKLDHKWRLPPSETISLAKKQLYNKEYSLTFNNCEHFATYCATGKKKSRQVRNVLGSLVGITLAVTGTVIRMRRAKRKM